MAVLARPDGESPRVGGTLVKYASEGIDVFLRRVIRGDSGRLRGYRLDDYQQLDRANPREAIATIVLYF